MLKVGLVGWGASTGNGGMNYDIARLAPWVTAWLCPKHPTFGWHEPYLKEVSEKVIKCEREGDINIYNNFLDSTDVVLFVEHPYLRDYNLVDECRRRNILTVCIPMWEWFPEQKFWSKNLDMVWCVSNYTRTYLETLSKYLKHRNEYCNWSNKIYGNKWGVELEKFKFITRNKANRFLFINGNGGGRALRKGSEIIAEAATYIPNIEITMLTQGDNYVKPMPNNVKIIEHNFLTKVEIYQYGDVLLAPTHWEGFGHTLYEAQACGIPVVTVDAPPMNECGASWLIPVFYSEKYKLLDKPISKVYVDPRKLAQLISNINETDISQNSIKARKYVEEHHNLNKIIKDLHEAIETLINSSLAKKNIFYSDGKYKYDFLLKNAWVSYQNKDLESMISFLLCSVRYTNISNTEILLNWIQYFENISNKENKNFDLHFFLETKEWNYIVDIILDNV